MKPRSLGSIIMAALVAGLLAGILAALFHFFLTEPVMERAIELEEQLSQAQHAAGEQVPVTRDVQRAGLFLGFIMYGVIWGLLFAALYHSIQSWVTAFPERLRSFLLPLLIGWSVALFPFFKYPANPPGVGNPETVQYRQIIFFAFIALSLANAWLSLRLHRYVNRPGTALRKKGLDWRAAPAAYVLGAAVLYLIMPANQDPVQMPVDLVLEFRALSWAGLALFWAVFSGCFAWLTRAGDFQSARKGSIPARLRVKP